MNDVDTARRVFGKLPLGDPSRQIRKLRFLPIEHEDDIRCELIVHDLEKDYLSYIAISYVWGDPDNEKIVEINGVKVRVRFNCWYALWQVRRVNPDSYLWIDSLCINQADNAEKSAQVKLMASVYSGAEFVAACIGPLPEYYSPSEYLEKYQRYSRETDIESILTKAELDDYDSHVTTLLEEIRRVEYFDRLWVVQECLLAKHIELYWGELHTPWASLVPLVDGRYAPKYHDKVKFLEDAILPKVQLSLPWIILIYAAKVCSVPHDNIYGLLSLFSAEFRQKIRIDYDQPLLALLRDFVRVFTGLDARSIREIERHTQRSIFDLMTAVEKLSESWSLDYKHFKADLREFLTSSEMDASKSELDETHFQMQISEYFWWPKQSEDGDTVHVHCAMLRRGHVPYASNDDISRRMDKVLHDLCHMPAIEGEFTTLHIPPVGVDVPFPARDFRVPSQTAADDILLLVQRPRKSAVDGGSMFLILRRSKEGPKAFHLLGFAAALNLYPNLDDNSEPGVKYRPVKIARPELTIFLYPDDVLILTLNRTTRQTHLRMPPSTLSQASYVEAPAKAFNDSNPSDEGRADVFVKRCIEAVQKDCMPLGSLTVGSD